jgi:hypothetical protein
MGLVNFFFHTTQIVYDDDDDDVDDGDDWKSFIAKYFKIVRQYII